MANDHKKKIAIVGVCSLILVAMVVALTIGSQENENKDKDVKDINASQKAITAICQSTDYKQECVESLKNSANDTTDPKKLIELAFEVSIKYIKEASQNSSVVQAAKSDPRAQDALDNCQELADRAINDLRRSFTKFNEFNLMNINEMLSDMKIWLSGAITNQETCLEGFEGVPGDAGAKMREALTKAMQMTSNGLAMITEISTYLQSMGIQTSNARRLLSELPVLGHGEELPDWMDLNGRKLLSELPVLGHGEELPDWMDLKGRKLLSELPVLGHGEELPDWMDFNGRKLLTTNIRKLEPDLIVAKDGSGKYKTINEALQHVPKNRNKTFVVYIKEGVYKEKVMINSSMTHLMILGDGPTKTKITGRLNFIDGVGTYHTATVAVAGDNFIAKDIGFENAAGPEKHQAVALRVSADKAIFYNCQMDGYQDTLYAHTYRQYYRNCVISGTIDFIFGDSASLFQNCTLVVRKPLENQQNIVTAQGRKDIRQPTGLVLQNCSFVADPEYYPFRFKLPSFLGRPWKEYSRTIIIESFIDDVIHPEGWLPWNGDFALNTLFYTEFNNRGPGSNKNLRLKWPGVKELPAKRIRRFLGNEFLEGKKWIKPTKVPYDGGFIFQVLEENPNIKYSPMVPEETKDLGNNKDKSSYIFRNPPPTSGSESNDNHHKALRSDIAAPPSSYIAAAPAPALALSPEAQPFRTPAPQPHGFSIFSFLRL